jgi:hypothetical protein
MKKVVKKILINIGTIAAMATVLTGCGASKQYIKSVEDTITDDLKTVMVEDGIDLNKFEILNVSVEKKGFNFDVLFNGVSSHGENDKAYTTVDYNVDSKYFVNLKKGSNTEDVFEVFEKIVKENKINSYSTTPVSSLVNINKALMGNTPSPFEGYSIRSGVAYGITNPNFNDETKEISFDVELIVKLNASAVNVGAGVGFSSGGVGIGVGITSSSKKAYVEITDTYKIDASSLDYESLKANPKSVFDYFSEKLLEKDGSTITAERVNVNTPEYSNSNTIEHKKLKDIDLEFSR